MRKSKFDGLEVQLASSILYYDMDELNRFMEVFDIISDDSTMAIDGTFVSFVNIVRKWKDTIEDVLEDPEERKHAMIEAVRSRNDHNPNADERETMNLWLGKVLETNVPMELADDILFHFIWEERKKAIELLDKSDISFEDKIESAMRFKIPQSFNKNNGLVYLDDVYFDEEDIANRYVSGNDTLDRFVQWDPGSFGVIAARPSVGKSLFMLQMGINNAKNGVKCLFVSKEMNKKKLTSRIINYYVGDNVRAKFVDDHNMLDVNGYRNAMENAKNSKGFLTIKKNLQIFMTDKDNPSAVLSDIEQQVKKNKYEIVFLDYLQLFKYPNMTLWDSIRDMTKDLKNLAMKLNIVIVTGSQVSRDSTQTGLDLTSLFGGSTIEADTDIVIGLEELRPRKGGPQGIINLKVLKNRDNDRAEIKVIIDYTNGSIIEQN